MKGYYFISDSTINVREVIKDVESALLAGAKVIQYREKNKETSFMYSQALEIKNLCAKSGSKLIINDRIDIALAVDAQGVHIGQSDMPYEVARKLLGENKIIGMTVHNIDEAVKAEQLGADYIGLSPIFSTKTKINAGKPCGISILKEIRKQCNIPIVAIGGISFDNLDEVIKTGADMVCMISAVITTDDMVKKIQKIQKKFYL